MRFVGSKRLARRMPTWTALKALVEEIKSGPASDSLALLQATRLNLPPAKSARKYLPSPPRLDAAR